MIRSKKSIMSLVCILTISSIIFLGCEHDDITHSDLDKKNLIVKLALKHGIPETAIKIDLTPGSTISKEELDEYFQILASIMSDPLQVTNEKVTSSVNGLPILSLSIVPRLKGTNVEQTQRHTYNLTWQNITVTTKTSNGAITFDSHTTGVGMWNYEHVSSYHNPSNGQFIIYGTTTFNYGIGRITYNVKITGEIKSGSPAINSISYSF